MNAEIQTAARNNIQRCEMLQIAPLESCSDLRETLCDSRRKWREIVEYMANKGPLNAAAWQPLSALVVLVNQL